MRESISAGLVALAMAACCTLPLLILSGVFATGSGLLLNQQTLLGLGILTVVVGGLFWFLLRKRSR